MRIKCLLPLLAAIICLPAVAFGLSAPEYPGSDTNLQLDLTNEDILPAIKGFIGMMPQGAAEWTKKVDFDALNAALKNVKRVQYTQLSVADKKTKQADLLKFYAAKLPDGEWRQMFRQGYGDGTIAIYVSSKSGGLYGYRIGSQTKNGETTHRIDLITMDGKVDYVKLILAFSKLLS